MSARVTVVLPVHNGERYLPKALRSLLQDDFAGMAVVVVDDASTDGTARILEANADPRVTVVRNESRRGVAAALNRGLSFCTSEFVARFDADDEWLPGRLEAQVSVLRTDPRLAVVGGQVQVIDPDGAVLVADQARYPLSPDVVRWRLLFENVLAHPAVTMRRSALDAVGGYREDRPGAEDYDLWLRMWPHYELRNVDAIVLRYRRHSASESFSRIEAAENASATAAAELVGFLLQRPVSEHILGIVRQRPVLTTARVTERDLLEAVAVLSDLRLAVRPQLSPAGRRYVDRWIGRRLLRMSRAHPGGKRTSARKLIRAVHGMSHATLGASLAAGLASYVGGRLPMVPARDELA